MARYSLDDLGFIVYQGEDPNAEDLWELVPGQGPAGNVAGETVRAISRIAYRFYNDGDYINVGYGKETCNSAAGFLIAKTNDGIAQIVEELCDPYLDNYEERLFDLAWAIRDFVTSDPALWEEPAYDMFQYDIPDDLKYEEDDEDDGYGYW